MITKKKGENTKKAQKGRKHQINKIKDDFDRLFITRIKHWNIYHDNTITSMVGHDILRVKMWYRDSPTVNSVHFFKHTCLDVLSAMFNIHKTPQNINFDIFGFIFPAVCQKVLMCFCVLQFWAALNEAQIQEFVLFKTWYGCRFSPLTYVYDFKVTAHLNHWSTHLL